MTQEEYKEEALRLRPRLLQTARQYLNEDDAEDTVQDVLLRLWQMVDTLRMPIDALATVLVRNFCIGRLRHSKPSLALTANYEQTEETENDVMSAHIDTDQNIALVPHHTIHRYGIDYAAVDEYHAVAMHRLIE